jgi:hypothetical protein
MNFQHVSYMNTQPSKNNRKYQNCNKNVKQNGELVFHICLALGKDINYFDHFVFDFCKWMLPSEWNVSRHAKKCIHKNIWA